MFSLKFFKSVLSGFTEVSMSVDIWRCLGWLGWMLLAHEHSWLHGAPSLRWSAFLFSEEPASSEERAFWPFQTHFTKYQRAQNSLLKLLFLSEMRFNAMPSGLAFLLAAVFFWDYCLVIVWFRPYSIALVINVELITVYWVITAALLFWDCFDSFGSHWFLGGDFYI